MKRRCTRNSKGCWQLHIRNKFRIGIRAAAQIVLREAHGMETDFQYILTACLSLLKKIFAQIAEPEGRLL